MARRTGRLGHPGGTDRRTGIARRDDYVLTVAVGAYRRVGLAASYQFAVDALPEIVLDVAVALAARFGNVEMVD